MFAIIDKRAPQEARDHLKRHFDVFEFISNGITYDAVSGHPDIFIFRHSEHEYIVAPNTPVELLDFLRNHNVDITIGDNAVGYELHNTTQFNCVTTKQHIYHKKGFTDTAILRKNQDKTFVELPQAYTRCSMISDGNITITSDKGIAKVLDNLNITHTCISHNGIMLPPYPNGFAGGCCGIHQNTIYIIGSLKHHTDGDKLLSYLHTHGYSIEELYDGPLYDGGGIFIGA